MTGGIPCTRTLACSVLAVIVQACFSTAPRAGDVDAQDQPMDPAIDDVSGEVVPDVPVDAVVPPGVCPWGWDCRVAAPPSFTGVDVLFVIDNSFDMLTFQTTFVDQFPLLVGAFLEPELDSTTGKPLHVPVTDVHVGVVSTDMGTGGYEVTSCDGPPEGDDGLLLHEPRREGCYPTYPLFLFYEEESPDVLEIASLAEDYACIASLGNEGCGFEHQLEAALKALTVHSELGHPNDGFLRRDSVLLVVWISTENDCSVSDARLFDLEDPTYGVASLRCYGFPEMLHPVDRYIDGLSGLAGSRPVILGMIVGVPPDEARCTGTGSALGTCLDVPDMRETTDPTDPTMLRPVCSSLAGDAFPARRFVQLAQSFGPRSYVASVCENDYAPAFDAMAEMVSGFADLACTATHVEITRDPADRCLCTTDCSVLHLLADRSPCPDGTWEWDADGDTVPNVVHNSSGIRVSACEVPYAGTRVTDCWDPCTDIYQKHSPDGSGWYYSFSNSGVACPSIAYTSGFTPPAGAIGIVLCPG